MKVVKIAVTVFVILILIFASYKIYNLFEVKKTYEYEIETKNAEISHLSDKNLVLEQDTIKLLKSIDSLSKLIELAKIDIVIEKQKRKDLELKKDTQLAHVNNLSELEQVKYFISFTKQDYPALKFNDYYLVSMNSIKFSNNYFISGEYNIKNNLSLIAEIKNLDDQIVDYETQLSYWENYKQTTDEMIKNKDKIIMNLNLRSALQGKTYKNMRRQRNISYGVALLFGGIAIIK